MSDGVCDWQMVSHVRVEGNNNDNNNDNNNNNNNNHCEALFWRSKERTAQNKDLLWGFFPLTRNDDDDADDVMMVVMIATMTTTSKNILRHHSTLKNQSTNPKLS